MVPVKELNEFELTQQVQRNLHEFICFIGEHSDFELIETSDYTLLCSKIPHQLFNYVSYIDDRHTPLKEVLAEIKTYFQKQKAPFLLIGGANSPNYLKFENNPELKYEACARCFYLPLVEVKEEIPHQDLTIRQVKTVAELKLFDQISALCFAHPEGMAYQFFQGLLPLLADPSFTKLRLLITDYAGEAAGISVLFNGHELDPNAGLYWAGVLPYLRKRGLNTFAALQRIKMAKVLNKTRMVVQCLSMSVSLYQKLNFKEVASLNLYSLK